MPETRFKRRRHAWASWSDDGLEFRVVATGARCVLDAAQVAVLAACGRWTTAEEVAARVGRDLLGVAADMESLADASLLQRSGTERGSTDAGLDAWGEWAPVASSFHFSTRDSKYRDPMDGNTPLLVDRPEPSPLKEYLPLPSVELPAFPTRGELAEALRGRRSWRTFGTGPATLEQLAALCGLTWAVQHWATFEGVGRQAMKTSPSGGARHSIEAYLGVRDVAGLRPGLYHYEPDAHALTLLREGLSSREIVDFLPEQSMYGEASFVAFQTSVFERVRWRYRDPRAYRNVFIEAGHLAQTFLTVATHLGLAPFCTAALAETRIEDALGLDAAEESVLYAVGAGPRPDMAWAPLPGGDTRGALTPPAYRRRIPEETP